MEKENEGKGTTEEEPATGENDLGDAGKRALDAERKARAAAERRAKEAEAKLKEADDAQLSETERLQGQVADLQKQAEAAQAKADRFEIAAAKGLNLSQARRLVGSTKEELEQDADEMRSELGLDKEKDQPKEDDAKGIGRGLPKEDLKAGASNAEDEQPDAGKLADKILERGW